MHISFAFYIWGEVNALFYKCKGFQQSGSLSVHFKDEETEAEKSEPGCPRVTERFYCSLMI